MFSFTRGRRMIAQKMRRSCEIDCSRPIVYSAVVTDIFNKKNR
jgi:hypothetical protein